MIISTNWKILVEHCLPRRSRTPKNKRRLRIQLIGLYTIKFPVKSPNRILKPKSSNMKPAATPGLTSTRVAAATWRETWRILRFRKWTLEWTRYQSCRAIAFRVSCLYRRISNKSPTLMWLQQYIRSGTLKLARHSHHTKKIMSSLRWLYCWIS